MPEGEYPGWWPAGATEESARVCGCDYCLELLDRLEDHREGVAVDSENRTLSSFSSDDPPELRVAA